MLLTKNGGNLVCGAFKKEKSAAHDLSIPLTMYRNRLLIVKENSMMC